MRYVTRISALEYEDFSSAKSRLLERAEKFGEISYRVRSQFLIIFTCFFMEYISNVFNYALFGINVGHLAHTTSNSLVWYLLNTDLKFNSWRRLGKLFQCLVRNSFLLAAQSWCMGSLGWCWKFWKLLHKTENFSGFSVQVCIQYSVGRIPFKFLHWTKIVLFTCIIYLFPLPMNPKHRITLINNLRILWLTDSTACWFVITSQRLSFRSV